MPFLTEPHAMLSDPLADLTVLGLLQLADSAFPSGGYAHSAGLEWLLGEGEVDLEAHLRFRLAAGLARLELPLLRGAYGARRVAELVELDALADALMPARELRGASRAIGHSVLRAATAVRRDGPAQYAMEAGIEHQPVAYGVVLRDWDIDLEAGLLSYAWQATRQQLAAAQRLGVVGQTTVQRLLHAMRPAMGQAVAASREVAVDEMGAYAPWLELASMQHERQFARLFLS